VKLNETPPVPGGEKIVTNTTAADLGNRLPLGFLSDGVQYRDFEFRPYKTKTERELDEVRRNKKLHASPIEWAATVLSMMLTRLGPHNVAEMKRDDVMMMVSSCFMADVLYMLIRLRMIALGSHVKLSVTCARCEHEWKYTIDLDTMDVKVAETPASMSYLHTLHDGIEISGKKYIELVVMPPRWLSLANTRSRRPSDNEVAVLMSSIRHAIPLNPGDPEMPVPESAIDEMTKRDFEVLKGSFEDESVGPQTVFECECPKCSFRNKAPLDWSWDFFFKSPSL